MKQVLKKFECIFSQFSYLLPGIVGIVCSSIGLAQKNSGKGQGIAGLITSIAGILLGFMILGLAMMDGNY